MHVAASDEIFQYHLTPDGWKEGSSKIDFSGWQKQPVPDDRLLTVGFREYMSSGFSGLDQTAEVETFAEDKAIAEALEKFGGDPHHSPDRYRGWPEFLRKIR